MALVVALNLEKCRFPTHKYSLRNQTPFFLGFCSLKIVFASKVYLTRRHDTLTTSSIASTNSPKSLAPASPAPTIATILSTRSRFSWVQCHPLAVPLLLHRHMRYRTALGKTFNSITHCQCVGPSNIQPLQQQHNNPPLVTNKHPLTQTWLGPARNAQNSRRPNQTP